MQAEIAAVIVVVFYVLAIVSALEVILQGRTAQGSIAWAISLLTFPLVTVPLYLVFGRNRFQGYTEKLEIVEAQTQRLVAETIDTIRPYLVQASGETPLYTSLLTLARLPATTGNEVTLLVDGARTFDSIAAGLERAQRYILFQFYILRDDGVGRRLCRILADKARAGVRVYLLYDEIGSHRFARTRLYRQLVMTGVKVSAFNSTRGRRNRFQLNFRNHRKVVVVDGKTAWIGGLNVGDEYLGLKPRFGRWRDTHTRFEGPAVLGAAQTFATDWLWATGAEPDIDWRFDSAAAGDKMVMVFPSNPASEYEEAGLMFHQIIVAARYRIWIASPYFVPDRAIISALQLAALRGVDVRILIPDEPDGPVVAMANWSYTRELLPTGVKIYRYQGGFMHQKVLLMDSQLAGVGTANCDSRSFRLNFEVTLLVRDEDFAAEVEAMLEADMGRCRQVSEREFDNKPAWFPLAMGVARLFSPVL